MGLSMSEVAANNPVTAGSLLRSAREAAGIHIEALAVALKVPVSKLDALEADNYEALLDTVFVRALAASVCRTLKLDPAQVLSLLPQSKSPNLSPANAELNTSLKGHVGKSSFSSPSFSGSKSRSGFFVVLALLIGAGIVFLLPLQKDDAEPAPAAPVPSAQDSAPGARPDTVSAVTVPSYVPGSQLPAVAGASMASKLMQGPGTAGVAAVEAPVATASSATVSVDSLVLRARSESWVQVRDSKGAVALQRKLAAGESVSIAAPLPLSVVIGRADATEVFVRGKLFDLTAVSRDNVARFEVK